MKEFKQCHTKLNKLVILNPSKWRQRNWRYTGFSWVLSGEGQILQKEYKSLSSPSWESLQQGKVTLKTNETTGDWCHLYKGVTWYYHLFWGNIHPPFIHWLSAVGIKHQGRTAIPYYHTTLLGCHNKYHSTNLFSQNFVEKKWWCQLSAPGPTHCFYMVWISISVPSVYLVCGACQNVNLLLNFLRQCLIVRKRNLFQSSVASAKLKSISEALRLSEFLISKFRYLSAQVSHSQSLLRKPIFYNILK